MVRQDQLGYVLVSWWKPVGRERLSHPIEICCGINLARASVRDISINTTNAENGCVPFWKTLMS
jgi:hypothetical protein